MKKFLTRFTELQGMMILGAIINTIICIAFLVVGILTGYYGWLYGALIGSFVELVSIFLLFKGSEVITKTFKFSLFLIFYFGRMVLFIAAFVICAWLQFGIGPFAKVEAFDYSIWGCLIAISPLQLIVIIIMGVTHKNPMNLVEKAEEAPASEENK